MAGNPRDPARLPRIDMGGCRLEAAFEGRSLGDSSRAVAMIWPSSAITAYEVAWQIVSGRIQGYGSVETSVLRFLEGVTMRPITPEIAALAAQFPEDYARDPADRLIGTTARAEGLTLVTRNERIRRSPLIRTVW